MINGNYGNMANIMSDIFAYIFVSSVLLNFKPGRKSEEYIHQLTIAVVTQKQWTISQTSMTKLELLSNI